MLSFFLDYYYANCTHTHTHVSDLLPINKGGGVGLWPLVSPGSRGYPNQTQSDTNPPDPDPDPDPDPKLKHEKRAPPP